MIPARDDFKNSKIFDDHFHIIDRRFPLISNSGYLHGDFTCENYLSRTREIPLTMGPSSQVLSRHSIKLTCALCSTSLALITWGWRNCQWQYPMPRFWILKSRCAERAL
jgi:hypothetical protein